LKKSAGILLYRIKNKFPEFFLVHYGGPFWAKKDLGSWSIPKGETQENENPLDAALREFKEETGTLLKPEKIIELNPVKQKAGKIVMSWAVEGNVDPASIKSNEVEIEWPPKSGKKKFFPEIDKGEWFSEEVARQKINAAQVGLIDELISRLS
jgi:predicted NUDIX family NTP pyrophosphohydrolase